MENKVPINEKHMVDKKSWGLLRTVSIVVILLVLSLILIFFNINSPESLAKQQLSLGNKYLAELDYEQAIVAFNKVIKIDPSIKEAYFGLAEAYIVQKEYAMAKDILVQGYEIFQDVEFQIRIGKVKWLEEEITEIGKNNEMESQVEEKSIVEIEQEIFSSKETIEVCERIMEAYQSEEYDYANELYSSWFNKNYDEIMWYTDFDFAILVDSDECGIGIYKSGIVNLAYMYCGMYKNDMRQGKGIYMYPETVASEHFCFTIGEWKNDEPNGEHRFKRYLKNGGTINGEYYDICYEVSGNVVDGLWDGRIFVEMEDGSIKYRSVEFECNKGKIQILDSKNINGSNRYLIGKGITTHFYVEEERREEVLYAVSDSDVEKARGLYNLGYGEIGALEDYSISDMNEWD